MELIVESDTVESAINKGLKKLKKDRNEVNIQIIDTGNKDFLGLTGNIKAKVKIEYENNPYSEIDTETYEEINEDKIKEIESILKEWLKLSNFRKCELKSTVNQNNLYIEISTLDSSILIGKHGSTLNAYQSLLNIVVNRKQVNTNGNKISIILDTENYRTKRRIALEKMTQRYVSKLNRTKKDVVFPSLNSKERKIIHNYILKNYNIISKSIGDEPNRRIKINFK